ncbi:MAG: hypothetical protein DMG12_20345 [Acidobacteria bacterium]|nr:MAG: hypothetical protein DMG12_20345 [Acidobacteriota bacterium]
MRHRVLGFVAALVIAAAVSAFGQAAPVGQAGAAAGQQRGQRGPTFTTNGNGGIVDADGQDGQRAQRRTGPARPAPRGPNGRVILGPPPGQAGLWIGGITNLTNPDNTPIKVPYQPWAQAVAQDRRQNQFEPHTRCKPSGGPRQFLTPYGVEFVELQELQRIFILDVGGPHSYRIIYMDGREHPKNLTPSYYGHNVGHWEGDTLVVDSVGYNERFWFDRGAHPHTEQLHLVERFTRVDFDNIKYEVTIDDPGAYTAPWSGQFNLRLDPGDELFEYVCQDNNFAPQLMLGVYESIDRSSPIIP